MTGSFPTGATGARISSGVGPGTGILGVDDEHVLGARRGEKLLHVRQQSHAARIGRAVLLEEIEHQQRRRLGIDRDGLELGRRRRLNARPFVDDALGARRRGEGERDAKHGKRQHAANKAS